MLGRGVGTSHKHRTLSLEGLAWCSTLSGSHPHLGAAAPWECEVCLPQEPQPLQVQSERVRLEPQESRAWPHVRLVPAGAETQLATSHRTWVFACQRLVGTRVGEGTGVCPEPCRCGKARALGPVPEWGPCSPPALLSSV